MTVLGILLLIPAVLSSMPDQGRFSQLIQHSDSDATAEPEGEARKANWKR